MFFLVIGVIIFFYWLWLVVIFGFSVMIYDLMKECWVGDEELCLWFMVFIEMKDKIKNLEKSYEE